MIKIFLLTLVSLPYYAVAQLSSIRPNKNYNEVAIRVLEDQSAEKVSNKPSDNIPPDPFKEIYTEKFEDSKEVIPILSEASEEKLKFSMPLPSFKITSRFGNRLHPILGNNKFHSGIDLKATSDTVKSVLDGVVVSSGYNDKLGYFVKINHNGNFSSIYGHLSQYFVKSDQIVKAGDCLGITGNTGMSTGEHLHFGVYYKNQPMDPISFLTKILKIQKLPYDKRTEYSYTRISSD